MTASTRTILCIEDDASIRQGLVDALAFAGYGTLEAADGRAGLERALRSECHLVLLDLMLPELDGMAVLQELRSARPELPVIVLTARGEESERVRGLHVGADDYVVKPFSVGELLARVEAVLRRSAERPSDITRIGIPGGHADFQRREVSFEDGARQELSERETALLRYLVVNGGRAVSRQELLDRVWGIDPRGVTTRTIDMHVARLREKLRDDPASPCVVVTVRGKGYMLGDGVET